MKQVLRAVEWTLALSASLLAGGCGRAPRHPTATGTRGVHIDRDGAPIATRAPSATQPPHARIAAGPQHTCVLLADHTARCWGYNDRGEVGDGTTLARPRPVAPAALVGLASLSADGRCAVTLEATVRCWGPRIRTEVPSWDPDDTGMVVRLQGAGDSPAADAGLSPVDVPDVREVLQVARGDDHACALRRDGSVVCWGGNTCGECGDGARSHRHGPLPVEGVAHAVQIAVTGERSCAVLSTGALLCWGELASNDPREAPGQACLPLPGLRGDEGQRVGMPHPMRVPNLSNVVEVALGPYTSCVRLRDGTVRCWDTTGRGGEHPPPRAPTAIDALAGAEALAVGGTLACARMPDATVRCAEWRLRGHARGYELHVTDVPALANVADLAMGPSHGCALDTDGQVRCWGESTYGQIGDGAPPYVSEPTAVAGVAGVTRLVAGERHTCALHDDHAVTCWGSNRAHETHPASPSEELPPTRVPGLLDATDLALGDGLTCAVRANGAVVHWGSDLGGRFQYDPGAFERGGPEEMQGASDAASVALGQDHACLQTQRGRVLCWGRNSAGQLGDGTTTDRAAPTEVPRLGRVRSIALGARHGCAIALDGTIRCWGQRGFGEANPGAAGRVRVVAGPRDVRALAAGGDRTCAVTASGALWCWGTNFTQGSAESTQVAAPGPVIGVAVGPRHACAWNIAGEAFCWGQNEYGQLGRERSIDRYEPTPQRVRGLDDVAEIAVGGDHSCARRSDRSVVCWGSDLRGQLGAPRTRAVAVPARVSLGGSPGPSVR